ncbi:MAG: tetratricopeptide repeat protein [Polyangiaceae bacterium]
MRTSIATLLLPAVLVSLVACRPGSDGAAPVGKDETKESTGAPANAPRTESTTAPKVDDALVVSRRLALSPAPGSAAVDTMIQTTQKSVERNPEKVDFWILLGRAWVRKARESADPGFYLNAKACADVAKSISPDNVAALNLEAMVDLSNHAFREALDVTRKILAKDADDPSAHGTESDAYLELGRYEEAIRSAQKMVDLKPNLPSYSRVSYLAWLRGDLAKAKETVRLALDSGKDVRDPEPYAWVLVQAGNLFLSAGDFDGADAGFDKALEWFPEFAPALVGKAKVAFGKGDAPKMVEYSKRAFTKSPLAETAWLRGDAETMAGNAAAADAAYATVVKEGRRTDPRTLALFFATKARTPAELEEAVKLAREEMSARPDLWSEDALAWALFKSGHAKEARPLVDHARALGTKDARLLYHQGAIHVATGDVASGKKLLAEAAATNRAFDLTGSAELARALGTNARGATK